MSNKVKTLVVYCDEPGCKWFTELAMEIKKPVDERLKATGWTKTEDGGDLCPKHSPKPDLGKAKGDGDG